MLKRPGFICEPLTDSGYHLCNCSVYWSQRLRESDCRGREELKKDTEGGIRIYKQGGGREKRGGKLTDERSWCIELRLCISQFGTVGTPSKGAGDSQLE